MQNPGSHPTSGTGIFYPKKRTHGLIETNGRFDWNVRTSWLKRTDVFYILRHSQTFSTSKHILFTFFVPIFVIYIFSPRDRYQSHQTLICCDFKTILLWTHCLMCLFVRQSQSLSALDLPLMLAPKPIQTRNT